MKNYLCITLFLWASAAYAQPPAQGEMQYPAREAPDADCGWDLEYDEERDLVYHAKSRQPYTGRCRTFYEDGRLEREANFIDGKEEGRSVTYYQRFIIGADGKKTKDKSGSPEPGNQWTITEFRMGLPHGTWMYYHENGRLAWENFYDNGLKTGTWSFYFEDGSPRREESYKNDKKDGTFKEFYPGAKLKSEINYKEDYLDGAYILYYENGNEFIRSNYKRGKEEGEVLSFHQNGQMATLKRYKDFKPEGTWRSWFDDGREKSVAVYIKGKKEGEHKEFYKEGQLKKRSVYKADKLLLTEDFDEFGNKIDPTSKPQKEEEY